MTIHRNTRVTIHRKTRVIIHRKTRETIHRQTRVTIDRQTRVTIHRQIMFVKIIHSHDRIILSQLCIVMMRLHDKMIRKIIGNFCTKTVGGLKIPLLGIPLKVGLGGWVDPQLF